MPRERAPGKKLIGAWISAELDSAITLWLAHHPQATLTDFIIAAASEKLDRAGITIHRPDPPQNPSSASAANPGAS
ncbi:MAG: hypothetical protein C5B50_12635 [Verrucomicrobia bacterium]|nr:MAG: hypothetical protein C5B50_12635 [Verrucomicrobiota bacterium]